MDVCAALLALLLQSPSSDPQPTPEASPPPANAPVIIFLMDNSASLPPIDPEEKRVAALEKIFTFLEGQPYRLILFGGRREVYVDDVSRYRNNGQWTDFFYAFVAARELAQTYPKGTEFRIILLTDGVHDPDPKDYEEMQVPPNALKAYAVQRLMGLLQDMDIPLYVILVGDPPKEGTVPGSQEQAPTLILDMVKAANGAKASPLAQSLASFFSDDGTLLRKFIYRVEPTEGLKKIEPVVRRIVAPSSLLTELRVLAYFVLPLVLLLFLLLGIAVRSFPGAGDVEIIEMASGTPVYVAVDRLHRLQEGGWAKRGLCLVNDAKDAAASFTYQAASLDLTGAGLDTSGQDSLTRRFLPMALEDLRRVLEHYSENGTKEEKIYVLNLDYMAKNFHPKEAERILTAAPSDRRRIPALDFLRAKVHLLSDDPLRSQLTEPRVMFATYGRKTDRKELAPTVTLRVGRYGYVVREVQRGGRKDARILLAYDRVPSLLGLKRWLPNFFQRIFRLRRSSQRIVTG